jgi:hypothetical protein
MTSTLGDTERRSVNRLLWHAPLLWLSVGMAVLALVCVGGLVIDHRVLTGAPIWAKPLKFAISVGLYSVTLSWLLGLIGRGRRVTWWLGTIVAAFLAIEMIIIVGAVIAGTTSHFNVSSPFATALWAMMAVSIVIVWTATIVVAAMLFRAPLGDRARSLAIRSGLVVAVIGMGLAFLMTGPQGSQVSNYQGIIGAHTVGLADGGPGLPLLGWSTVAGDLRIPHFVGMHAMQALPLVAIALEILARRIPALGSVTTRFRILLVTVVLYLGVLAVLTLQALAGQSIVRPDAAIASVTIVLFAAATVAGIVVVTRGRADAAA